MNYALHHIYLTIITMIHLYLTTGFLIRPYSRPLINRSFLRSIRKAFSDVVIKVEIENEEKTEALGSLFASSAEVGDVLLLRGLSFTEICFFNLNSVIGDLGAGKTTFTRGYLRTIYNDKSMLVTSPSYLLDNKYDIGEGASIHHMDLYRLPSNSNLSFLGIPRIFDEAVCLIEWPERLGNFAPKSYVDINLTINEDESRMAKINYVGDRWISRAKLIEESMGEL